MDSTDGELEEGGQVLADIRYQLIWATRRRRAFLEGPVLARTVELLTEAADAIGVAVKRVASGGDFLVVTVEAPPDLAPAMILSRLKCYSASALRQEFPSLRALPSIWTRRALVTTLADFPERRIRDFVERQPRNERRAPRRAAPRDGAAIGAPIEVLMLAPPEYVEIPESPAIIDEP